MPLLRERIYAKSSFARQFVISWISVLDMVPNIDLVLYLPDLLDGLFRILDDPMLEVRKMCETTLGEFLRSIKSDPSRVDFPAMINILINHAQEKHDDLVQVRFKISYFFGIYKKCKYYENIVEVILQEPNKIYKKSSLAGPKVCQQNTNFDSKF